MAERIIKSTKEIMGVEPATGSEWDAGYVPCGVSHRRVRITVRKEAPDDFAVYAVGLRGAEPLLMHLIGSFPCETCAKAFALCLVFGVGYAACSVHDRDNFGEREIFDGTTTILRALMGINNEAWDALDEGARHRVMWTAREILDGQKDWGKVIAAWEFTETQQLPKRLDLLICHWHSRLSLL